MEPLEAAGVGLFVFFGLIFTYVLRSKQWRMLIFLCGAYILCDGLVSVLMYYPGQAVAEYVPRVLRLVVGGTLMLVGAKGWGFAND